MKKPCIQLWCLVCIGLTLLASLATVHAAALAGRKPNIIIVLTDDQGYGDLARHGNPIIKTPNLDRMHDESARFTDFHVSPTCAPTRSSLMSGKHEFKNGITHTIFERERMSLKTFTLAQLLKSAGYTTGIFGKWHLGDESEYQPGRRGFDEVFIHGAGGIGQSYPGSCGDAPGNTYFNPAILHNGKFEKTKGYCTDVFFGQAMEWIQATKGKAPFFVYITPNAPHAPLQVPPEWEQMYTGKVPEKTAKYFGMVSNIDDNMGKLLAKLKALGIEKDTLVIFMNDNGGTGGVQVFNDGMRGQKGTPWLGGTRAMSFWNWPGTLAPLAIGKLAAHIDIYPTLAELTGAKIPANVKLDGRSLLPLLANPSAEWPDRYLFTHVGRWAQMAEPETGKYANCSVRNTQYHLVSVGKETKPNWELYDVKADYGEKNNIAAQNPAMVTQLAAVYEQWWQEVLPCLENEKVQGPKVNPFKELYWKQFPDERPADWDKPKSDLDSAPAGAKSAKKGKKKTEQ